jgi:hypothetical protein
MGHGSEEWRRCLGTHTEFVPMMNEMMEINA